MYKRQRVEFSLAPSAAARHPERSEAQPSEVEGSRAATAHTPPIGAAEGVAIEPARTKPVTVDDVRAHVDRLGQTPFLLESLEVELDEGVGIGFSQLHRVRAAALDDLAQQLLAPTRNRALPRVRAVSYTHLALLGIPGIIIAWLVNVDKMPQVKSDALKFAIIGFCLLYTSRCV